MMSQVLVLSLLCVGPFKEGVHLAPLPEDFEFLLQSPASFDLDAEGNYYIIDFGAQVVFVWRSDGAFARTIGRPGNGPGEFNFSGGGATAFLSVVEDRLIVLDGRETVAQIFNLDGTFVKSVDLDASRSRALNFDVTQDGRFMLQLRDSKKDGLFLTVKTFDPEGNFLSTLAEMRDTLYEVTFEKKEKKVKINAFHPTQVTSFNCKENEILIGDSKKHSFEVWDLNGKGYTIDVPLKRNEVTQSDKDEMIEVYNDNARRPTLIFPEYKSCYTHLHSLGNKGFLAYQQSPYYGDVAGVFLDRKGQVVEPFNFNCGAGGGLLTRAGRILRVHCNQDNEFVINELYFPSDGTSPDLLAGTKPASTIIYSGSSQD
jgi:hypothetical protein